MIFIIHVFIYIIITIALVTLNSYLVLLCFWILSIFFYSEQNTKFRKVNLYQSSGKRMGSTLLCPSDRNPETLNNIGCTSTVFSAPLHKYRNAISNLRMIAYLAIHINTFFSNCRPIQDQLTLATEIVIK